MNDIINIGDVFVGTLSRSFKELVVQSKISSFTYAQPRWRCGATRHNGETTVATVYESTLLNRYTRKPTRDFNVDTDSYSRPMVGSRPQLDVPAVSTPLIRDAESVSTFIGEQSSTLLHFDGSNARQAKGKDAKVSLLLEAMSGLMVLAVPGKYSMDVFYVDSRTAALQALGLRQSAPIRVVTDAFGNTWVAA